MVDYQGGVEGKRKGNSSYNNVSGEEVGRYTVSDFLFLGISVL